MTGVAKRPDQTTCWEGSGLADPCCGLRKCFNLLSSRLMNALLCVLSFYARATLDLVQQCNCSL